MKDVMKIRDYELTTDELIIKQEKLSMLKWYYFFIFLVVYGMGMSFYAVTHLKIFSSILITTSVLMLIVVFYLKMNELRLSTIIDFRKHFEELKK